ncbi:MAG TPA: hypothetical protein VJ464_24590 [Blastocatellia bacterium]|nr:hypothetical protein [Blastocatellia bacterium]
MAAYFQMGDRTENLVGETDLDDFTGIILSPINRKPEQLLKDVSTFQNKDKYKIDYDIILDPQLYVPRGNRGHLPEYTYFPTMFDTLDSSTASYWEKLSVDLSDYAKPLSVNAVASPAIVPNVWSDDYYANCVQGFKVMADKLSGTDKRPLFTLIVGFAEMESRDYVLNLASIVSGTNPSGYYLIIKSDFLPRREMVGEMQLAGIMELINALEATGKPVLVSHCDSEMLLFKAAGAKHCATGKNFNLRRFTKSRYEDKSGGKGQAAYWFEQSILAYIQEADIGRLQRRGLTHLLGVGYSNNHWSAKILTLISNPLHKEAWVKLGARQYLAWFGKTEKALTEPDATATVEDILLTAEGNWAELKTNRFIFSHPLNDGLWVRDWRLGLDEYSTRL